MEPPVIKWSGSKRRIASQLAAVMPSYGRYFEPFLGGGAMLAQVRPHSGLASDVLPELMSLWTMVRDQPGELSRGYERHWTNLQKLGHTYFYEVRAEFNQTRDPVALLFLSRTCVNGLIRFNNDGAFNNSLHHTRPGIHPSALDAIIRRWSGFTAPLELRACDYRDAVGEARSGDFVFLDPPYAGNKGRYMPGKFDIAALAIVLQSLTDRGVNWMLTLDGTAGDREYAASLPALPATSTFRVSTGHSPFTRLMRSSLDDVLESVHLNFDPVSQTLC